MISDEEFFYAVGMATLILIVLLTAIHLWGKFIKWCESLRYKSIRRRILQEFWEESSWFHDHKPTEWLIEQLTDPDREMSIREIRDEWEVRRRRIEKERTP